MLSSKLGIDAGDIRVHTVRIFLCKIEKTKL